MNLHNAGCRGLGICAVLVTGFVFGLGMSGGTAHLVCMLCVNSWDLGSDPLYVAYMSMVCFVRRAGTAWPA